MRFGLMIRGVLFGGMSTAVRGRKPKPTALKILEGNPGKRPLNEKEPRPPKAKTLKCPVWLEPEAKKEWRRLAASLEAMGVLTEADISAFAGYCQACARWRGLKNSLSELVKKSL